MPKAKEVITNMDEFLIQLQAILNRAKSEENINKAINRMQKRLNKLKLQTEIDPNAVQKLAEDIGNLVNEKIVISNIEINRDNLSKTGQQAGKIVTDEVENALGKITSNKIEVPFTVKKTNSDEFIRAVNEEIAEIQKEKNEL